LCPRVCIHFSRSHTRPYVSYVVTDSVDARRKNVPLLLCNALASPPEPQAGQPHFSGRRWRCCRAATATSTGSPALCTSRVQTTPAGCPAPCYAPRHQLVPRAVEPILRLRAVKLARHPLPSSRLPWPARLCAAVVFPPLT
jgi:hypothetical protein